MDLSGVSMSDSKGRIFAKHGFCLGICQLFSAHWILAGNDFWIPGGWGRDIEFSRLSKIALVSSVIDFCRTEF